MLSELAKAVEEFDNVSDDELGYCEGEILGFAFYADVKSELKTTII
ncbi:hypothetical protein SAMN04515654_1283 [Halanaerobium congolense]|uniref:Uncharacterized protein n=1 Tax=Halanaerobium congolense TaxID=54121 RepID=A0A1G8R0M6_9FIRM|nr:hypothetical protein [Halanaerobium congolense]SDJ10549.1 hypothetical protein SAMN04515654_1283 [Halanaerobium congolense]SET65590.1 hypothetical protein SAMN04515653_12313 [Halanaerobium congolense]